MNNHLERGGRGRTLAELANPRNFRPSDYILIAGILGAAVWGVVDHRNDNIANQFVPPQGASEVLPLTGKHPATLVYEGQNEPKCPGDIEKVVPMKDGNGNFRALNVICKPSAAEPGK